MATFCVNKFPPMTAAKNRPNYHKTVRACYGAFRRMLWSGDSDHYADSDKPVITVKFFLFFSIADRRGRYCRQGIGYQIICPRCPIGTYNPHRHAVSSCTSCRPGWTTPRTGHWYYWECRLSKILKLIHVISFYFSQMTIHIALIYQCVCEKFKAISDKLKICQIRNKLLAWAFKY